MITVSDGRILHHSWILIYAFLASERPGEGSCELKEMGRSHGKESEMYFRCGGKPLVRFKQRIAMI